MARRTKGRRCSFESLENRRLLAGDVSFKVVNGNAVIKGDKRDNVIVVTSSAAGSLTVTGTGTTVNGDTAAVTLTGVTGGLKIDLGKGNDNLTVGNTTSTLSIAGKMKVKGRSGNDTILIQNTDINSSLKVGLSKGDDNLTLSNIGVATKGTIVGRSGVDHVVINGVTGGTPATNTSLFDSLDVRLGRKDDTLSIADTTVTTSTILNGGRGTNTFTQSGTNSLGGLQTKHFS